MSGPVMRSGREFESFQLMESSSESGMKMTDVWGSVRFLEIPPVVGVEDLFKQSCVRKSKIW